MHLSTRDEGDSSGDRSDTQATLHCYLTPRGCYHWRWKLRNWKMNIKLSPEQEKIVKDELQSGHFRDVEEVIAEALQALREKERSHSAAGPNSRQREAVREMLAFMEKNHTRLDTGSVKELIHEGHRL
jgi:Arc/MetJ-type ribon-helix-helix transcriptional regulator